MSVRDLIVGMVLAWVVYRGHEYYTQYQRQVMVTRVTQRDVTSVHKLQEHSKVFNKKEILQVTPNVYAAVGFALANSIMVVGDDGVIIVDVTESIHAGKEVLKGFRNITNKPIKALIYTHNHADHTYGAKAFIEDPAYLPEIWAHADLTSHLQRHFYTNAILLTRASRQFGIYVPAHINSGIGPRLRIGVGDMDLGIIYPNKIMVGVERDLKIAGITLKLVHIPGETEDQIGVWLPGEKAFLCADDVYQAFPNLYAIRGTPTRDLLHWSSSLDRIIALKPQYLVPSHTRPIVGEETIRELLTGYRDAIQFVHDQTLRYMNRGFLPDEIAERISLPAHLAGHPYLQEFYGTVEWSVKGVFNAYMGWFSGDPVDLSPLTPNEMARRMVDLAGGVAKVTAQAEEALKKQEYQWALVLSSYVLRVDKGQSQAREVKAQSLMALGDRQTSANGRNYYYTTALEELGEVTLKVSPTRRQGYIRQVPMLNLFKSLQVRWDAEGCGVVNSTILFKFTDTNEVITMTTRNSVVLVDDREGAMTPDIKVTTTSSAWRESLISSFSSLTNLATGDITIDGSFLEFKNVMGCFDKAV